MKLLFDTETTGLVRFNLDSQHLLQPRIVSIACILIDDNLQVVQEYSSIVKPHNYTSIEPKAQAQHGISIEQAENEGIDIDIVRGVFIGMLMRADGIVGHNLRFDKILCEREGFFNATTDRVFSEYCTMLSLTPICKLAKKKGNGYKWPKLQEAYFHCFGREFDGAHNSLNDIRATLEIYKWLKQTVELTVNVFREPLPLTSIQAVNE